MKQTSNHLGISLVLVLVLAFSHPAAAGFCESGNTTNEGSLCVGWDCECDEVFESDTLRFREHALRIHFDDTSEEPGFVNNDWRLTINEIDTIGLFAIDDITNSTRPFAVEANAPSNSLHVDRTGHVGFGTSIPTQRLHAVQGDTPVLRLAQDGSAGFTPRTWDIGGNESSFFVRDAGRWGSAETMPFRIMADAENESLVIRTGRVTVGQTALNVDLEVRGDVTVGGDFSAGSSRHMKHSFEAVEPRVILDRLLELPVTKWSYRAGSPDARHIGPTSEDFRATFGLGRDDRHVSPVDLSGVALAAIQGLHQALRERDDEIARLEQSRDELAARLSALERRLTDALEHLDLPPQTHARPATAGLATQIPIPPLARDAEAAH